MIKIYLKEVLEQKGLTITDLSNETGIARSTITPIVNSPEKVKSIRFETLDTLCGYLNVKLSDLLTYEAEKNEMNFIKASFSVDKKFGIFEVERETDYRSDKGYLSFWIEKDSMEETRYRINLEVMTVRELNAINEKLKEHKMESVTAEQEKQNEIKEWINTIDRKELVELSMRLSSIFIRSRYYDDVETIEVHWAVGSPFLDTDKNTVLVYYDIDTDTLQDISPINDAYTMEHENMNLVYWDLIEREKEDE